MTTTVAADAVTLTVRESARVSFMLATVAKVCEGFFVVDSDLPQDSSCEITVLETVLDKCYGILQSRGCEMPAHLVIEAG